MSEYRFWIANSYTPETLPMDRLAEYMAAYARLLGETSRVHFQGVETGSAILVAAVDEPAGPKVYDRVHQLQRGSGSRDAVKAFEELDEMLRRDNATGELRGNGGAVVLPFPGRSRPEPLVFGPIRQEGSLEGQVIRVGGKDDSVPVHLRDETIIYSGLNATPDLARKIAQHLLGPTLRVYGSGTWYREGDGSWVLKSFKINDFEVLDDDPLEDVVAALRKVKGSNWNEVSDPVRALLEDRHGSGDAN
ncbi:hypothetical protein ELI29_18630 [Rhizobium leguminosarum]|uniref:hypothetical protein n=1 Tax=Rhizobium brockwellii TaxID=3019932 RepID=UPI0010CE7D92|nr:hypothetical protein ELI29_18630 [Rhizobium leguminosarum]